MSRQAQQIMGLSITATGVIGEYRFVTPACAQAGAAVNTLGLPGWLPPSATAFRWMFWVLPSLKPGLP